MLDKSPEFGSEQNAQDERVADALTDDEVIAVVGIGCRFPRSISGVESYWAMLSSGTSAIAEVPSSRFAIDAMYDPNPDALGRANTKWGGFLEDIQGFDAGFFDISPREASSMDPQQRILLEVVHEALEDASLTRRQVEQARTGVFIGISASDYGMLQRYQHTKTDVYAGTGSALSIAANRISHRFNLNGPSSSVDTACSSSLVALDQAVVNLREGRCDIALAGGVNVLADPGAFVAFSKAGMLSPTGTISTFDQCANGYVRGEGAGIVVLKRLSDALAAGDRIYARVRATCVNQDGRTSTLTAPNGAAQKEMLRELCRRALVSPETVDYIEAHGTGTPVGDPIEADAIGSVFGQARDGEAVLVGSVKPNIGHLESAAGISGFIKGVLIAQHGRVPPNANFANPNPNIPFDALNIRVPREMTEIADDGRAPLVVVNSFGFGGTNASALIEGHFDERTRPVSVAAAAPARAIALPVSGASDLSLRGAAGALASALQSADFADVSLADVAAAVGHYRSAGAKRAVIVAENRDQAIDRLRLLSENQLPPPVRGQLPFHTSGTAHGDHRIAFTFSGQGGQWWGMARRLIHEDAAFRSVFDRFDTIFADTAGWSIKAEILKDERSTRVNQSLVAQPGIFGVQIALAGYWAARGVRPDLVVGHSFGEIAAAHVAGALDLESATRLISARALVHDHIKTPGTMMAVGLSPDAFHTYAGEDSGIEIAAFNGPTMITVSGSVEAIDRIQTRIAAAEPDTLLRKLQTDTAWHSHALDDAEEWFRKALGTVACRTPTVPFASTVTGKFETVTDLDYWWANLRQPVRYQTGVELALATGADVFLELSPHRVLSGLTAGIAANSQKRVVIANSLLRDEDDFATLAIAAGELFCTGVPLDWPAVTGGSPFKGGLPVYVWDRQPYWSQSEEARELLFASPSHPLLGSRSAHSAGFAWINEFNLTSNRDLSGHAIDGDTIFPAAGYLEIMLAAGREALGEGTIELIDVEFRAALFIGNDDNVIMATSYDPRSGLIEVASRVRDETPGWTVRARGHMRLSDAPIVVPEAASVSGQTVDHTDFYRRTTQHGLQYANSFQSVEGVEHDHNVAAGRVVAPEKILPVLGQYLAHPGLFDSALQTVVVLELGKTESSDEHPLYLPVGVRRLRFGAPLPAEFTVETTVTGGTVQLLPADYIVRDPSGQPLMVIDGLMLKHTSSRREEKDEEASARHFLETFTETELPATAPDALAGSHFMVVAETAAQAKPLISMLDLLGAKAEPLAIDLLLDFDKPEAIGAAERWKSSGAKRAGFIYAAPYLAQSLDERSSGEEISRHVERMASGLIGLGRYLNTLPEQSGMTPDVVVLTRASRGLTGGPGIDVNGLAGAAMMGLVRTVANECPTSRFIELDTDSDISGAELASVIADERGESEWVLRGDTALVPRLKTQMPNELPAQRIAIDAARDAQNFEITMRAPGSINGLLLKQNAMPEPGPGQVVLRTLAVGLNFRDVMAVTGLLPAEAEPDPAWLNLGLEYSGRVVSVGEGVSSLKPGDRVMAMGRRCLQAYQAVRADQLIALPDNIGDDEAATIPSAFATAHYALVHVGRLRKGERILIHLGTGGVGLAAIQIARNIGAEIFATAGSEHKREYLRKLGIRHVMHSRSLSFYDDVLAATNGEGVDVVLNALPTGYIEKGVQLLRPFGRFLEIGKRDVYADTPIGMHALRRNISFSVIDLAAMGSERPDILKQVFEEVATGIAKGELKPLPLTRFPADKAVDAFRLMSQAKHIGKVVVGFGDGPVEVAALTGRGFAARANGNYLVTGGSRGFGIAVADWLSRSGAGEVTLASRSGKVDEEVAPQVEAMRARGTVVTSRKLDVADGAAVDALIAELAGSERKLVGIFHGAAYIQDGFISQLDRKTIAAVIDPKVAGGWNLHRALEKAGIEVDHFVSFSSLAQVIGSIGQANYTAANAFLDGLAFYRRGHGKAGLTIDWGALGGSGFVARNEALGRYLDSLGMEQIDDTEAFGGLSQSLESDVTSVAYARVDWPRVGRALGARGTNPRLSLVMTGRREGTNQIQADLAAAPQSEWATIVEGFLVNQVATVLGIDSSEVTLERALTELGFDSLSSIELKNRLESQLSLSVSVGTFLQAKTLKDLGKLVVELLIQKARAEAVRAEGSAGEAGTGSARAADDGSFVAAPRQLRGLALATGPMTSYDGRLALETAATLELAFDPGLGALDEAWSALCGRHPLLNLRPGKDGLATGETPRLAAGASIAVLLTEPLDVASGELVRAAVQEAAADGSTILGLRVHTSVADAESLRLVLTEWAALAEGRTLPPAPSHADVFAALRRVRPDAESAQSSSDRAYWHALMTPWPSAAQLQGRRLALPPVGLGVNSGHAGELTLRLAALPADRNAEAFLLASFAMALVRRLHLPSVVVARHASDPLAGSAGPWTGAIPVILRSDPGEIEVAARRVGRQLADGQRHLGFDLASSETEFGADIRRTNAVPSQFGFTFISAASNGPVERFGLTSEGHDIHLRVVADRDGCNIDLVFDTAALDEASARSVLAGFASIATDSADHLYVLPQSASARKPTSSAKLRANGATRPRANGAAAPSIAADRRAVVYPMLPSTRTHMSLLRLPETTRTFVGNWNFNRALLMRPGIDLQRMQSALASVVARHDTLRARYRISDDQMLTLIDETYSGKMYVEDLGEVSRAQLRQALDRVAVRPFDLERGPLFELHVFKAGSLGDAVLIHLCEFVGDGWSMALIADELIRHYLGTGAPEGDGTRYSSLLKATALPSDPAERAVLDAYWRGVFADPVPRPRFGRIVKNQPPATPGMQAPYQSRAVQISPAGTAYLHDQAARLGVNENALWAAGIVGAAARQAGAETVYFAGVHPMRNAPALRDKIALIAGLLPTRADVAEAGSFDALAQQLHTRFAHNSAHSYPGLVFDPPLTMPDGTPTAQAAWTQWAYGRLLPEHITTESLAAPLIEGSRGSVLKVLSAEIESVPMNPYGFTRGDFSLRPLTTEAGIEISLFHDLLSLTPGEAQTLIDEMLDDMGFAPADIGEADVSEVLGDPQDIARLNQGMAPEPFPYAAGNL